MTTPFRPADLPSRRMNVCACPAQHWLWFAAGIATLSLWIVCPSARANLYVTNGSPQGMINEFTNSGVAVETPLVTHLTMPLGIAVSDGNLYVGDINTHISEYSTAGVYLPPPPLFLSYGGFPEDLAVSDGDIFVVDSNGGLRSYSAPGVFTIFQAAYVRSVAVSNGYVFAVSDTGTVSEFTTAGVPINLNLITGLSSPWGIAVAGDDLFITNGWQSTPLNGGTIAEYTTAGAPVNTQLVTGLNSVRYIVASDGDLFVMDSLGVGKYTTSGVTVNSQLISGSIANIAVDSVPEASTLVLASFGLIGLISVALRRALHPALSAAQTPW